MLLAAALPTIASTGPGVPAGVQPLPIDPLHCDPTGDEERYRKVAGGSGGEYASHGAACLNEGRYADAIPELERAAALNADPRTLVALGVAYDGVGRFREASDRWRQARRLFSLRHSGEHFDFDHPIGLESALFARRYANALSILEQYFTPHVERGSSGVTAPYNIPIFEDAGLIRPFSDALRVAAQGNPQRGAELISPLYSRGRAFGELRYARAIMLLAIGRRDEARFELRIAARLNTIYPHDRDPHPFQWSALAILERLEASQKR